MSDIQKKETKQIKYNQSSKELTVTAQVDTSKLPPIEYIEKLHKLNPEYVKEVFSLIRNEQKNKQRINTKAESLRKVKYFCVTAIVLGLIVAFVYSPVDIKYLLSVPFIIFLITVFGKAIFVSLLAPLLSKSKNQ